MKIKRYSKDEIRFVKENFRSMGNKAIGKHLGRSADSVKHQMKRFGLVRSEEEVTALRKAPNKGMFKKGHDPHNTKYNGYERINKYGYIEVRISKGFFKEKHRILWEKHFGKIEKGMNIIFKDGNKRNIVIQNLKKVPDSYLAIKNHNREKAAKSLKKTWSLYFSLHQMGIKRGWYKNI